MRRASMRTTPGGSTRREFLRQGGVFLAAGGLAVSLPAALADAPAVAQPRSANERIRIGHIGVGNQGRGNLRAHLANPVAVCDVDRTRLAAAKEQVERA